MRRFGIIFLYRIWRKPRISTIIFFLVVNSNFAISQSMFQFWTDYNVNYKFKESWSIGGDMGYRITPQTGSQLGFVRPSVGYRVDSLCTITSGLANFNTWKDELNKSFELRPFMFIHLTWPRFKAGRFVQRFGLEQRWFKRQPNSINTSDQRFRYLVEFRSSELNLDSKKIPLLFLANAEFFRDFSNEGINRLFDHNRFSFAAQVRISEKSKIETRYTLISLLNEDNAKFEHSYNVFRLRIFYSF